MIVLALGIPFALAAGVVLVGLWRRRRHRRRMRDLEIYFDGLTRRDVP